jgi:hypothetical protein
VLQYVAWNLGGYESEGLGFLGEGNEVLLMPLVSVSHKKEGDESRRLARNTIKSYFCLLIGGP